MRERRWSLGALLVLLVGVGTVAVGACHRPSDPQTPEQLVAALREAWQRKDVDAVMALTADPSFAAAAGVRDDLRRAIRDYDRDREREELDREFKREGVWFRAWSDTRYVSSREHGDHFHVTVSVGKARSEVVLVREGGVLKIHPRPSSFP